MKRVLLFSMLVVSVYYTYAQCPATPNSGTDYGTGNVWIGYMYNNMDFTDFAGTVTEGTAGSPGFFQEFGGGYVNYPTSGCNVYTESFSARYRLRKNFAPGVYEFTVGGNDGIRLSLDGGNTWVINEWRDQSYTLFRYTTELEGGDVDLVLEFYENSYTNEVSFGVAPGCLGSGTQTDFGTADVWNGYMYEGINFQAYKGRRDKGTTGNPDFIEDFGNAANFFSNTCMITADHFSARFKLRKSFPNGTYTFNVGGDDGYRLNLDGGATWVIDNWSIHGYVVTQYTVRLNGSYDLVLEYFDAGGGNLVSFGMLSVLPIRLLSIEGKLTGGKAVLHWSTSSNSTADEFIVEKSTDGRNFNAIGQIKGIRSNGATGNLVYNYTDPVPLFSPAFYRLKMTDLEGPVTYSKIITINNTVPREVKIYPTLVEEQQTIFVQVSKNVPDLQLRLYNTMGQLLQQQQQQGVLKGQVASFPLHQSRISKGTYIIEVCSGKEVLQKQLILVR